MSMRKIYRELARKHKISVQELKQEMQAAINEAWKNPNKSAEMMAEQKEIGTGDRIPTIEEVILYAKGKIEK